MNGASRPRSEFDQGFAIDCSVRLEWVMLRPNEGVSETDAEAMLVDLFDIEGTWHTHGGREHRWRDLVGRFGD